MIYHFTTQAEWDAAQADGIYLPKGFQTDGFIHCSDHYQLRRIANFLFKDTEDLICLKIDADKLESPVVYENLEGGEMLFPHLYGPLPVNAVADCFEMLTDEEGNRVLPPEQRSSGVALFTEMPLALPGKLFRSPTPGSYMFDPNDEVFEKYIEAGIDVVIVLSPEAETQRNAGRDLFKRYRDAGFQIIHAPVEDFSAPPQGWWDATIARTLRLLKEGKNVVAHCHAGLGRTGMFIANLAQDALGLDADEAIAWTRKSIPGAIDTYQQKQFVRNYKKK